MTEEKTGSCPFLNCNRNCKTKQSHFAHYSFLMRYYRRPESAPVVPEGESTKINYAALSSAKQKTNAATLSSVCDVSRANLLMKIESSNGENGVGDDNLLSAVTSIGSKLETPSTSIARKPRVKRKTRKSLTRVCRQRIRIISSDGE